jgi:hypothetical protein
MRRQCGTGEVIVVFESLLAFSPSRIILIIYTIRAPSGEIYGRQIL